MMMMMNYCRGTTVQHAMLVNSCYVSRGMGSELERFQTATLTLKVIGNGAIR